MTEKEIQALADELCSDPKFRAMVVQKISVTLLILAIVLFLSTFGCQHSATVTPRIVESPGASYDNGERNSGVIGFVDCGEGRRCVLATPRFRARYNDLIIRYGQRFVPPIEKDYGVLDTGTNAFVFTKEAMQKSGEMHAWRASGQ